MYLICTKLQHKITCLASRKPIPNPWRNSCINIQLKSRHKNQGINNTTIKMNHVLKLSVQIYNNYFPQSDQNRSVLIIMKNHTTH